MAEREGGLSETWWAASCGQLSLAWLLWSSKEGWGTLCKMKMQLGGCIKTKAFASVFTADAN